MSIVVVDWLERLVTGLPDEASVCLSAAYVRSQLCGTSQPDYRSELLTIASIARTYGRAESTVRAWCARGDFPGAYKLNGKAWRVPASAVWTFDERQAKPLADPVPALGEAHPADLGMWRRERG
jgi:hypothetical protein